MPVFEELSVFNMEEADQLLERVLQVMHILRNFSHLPHHAKAFLSEQSILTLLAKALALPLYSSYIEVKRHSLDIFENLAASITVRGKNDFYLACVKKMLFDKDRSLVIGALRSISRLCNAESNNPVMADADPIMLNRLFQLMLVPNDEEVVYAVLDVIYMISCFGSDASSKIAACVPSNVVKLLLAFLQEAMEQSDKQASDHPRPSAAAEFPAVAANASAPGSTTAARGRPRKAEGSSTPLQNPQQQSDPLFQQQQQALIMQQHQQQHPQTPCLWGTVMTGDDGNQFLEVSCDFRAASQQELLHHVQTAHSDGSNSFQCSWAGCTALAGKSLTLEHGMRHFVTHLPRTDVSTSNASAGTDSGLSKAVPPSSRSAPDVSTDLRGTPLTVLLVLRNLARVPKNRELFVAYEIDLMILMAERPKLAKMIGDILWELK
ncbi:hypothetical protein DFJ73DRAFT_625889 [Zopfochytrium polystomum]|nr:hypothetical protein DFJ73DRAFT_625889 [Zopfochytrium polystomum]